MIGIIHVLLKSLSLNTKWKKFLYFILYVNSWIKSSFGIWITFLIFKKRFSSAHSTCLLLLFLFIYLPGVRRKYLILSRPFYHFYFKSIKWKSNLNFIIWNYAIIFLSTLGKKIKIMKKHFLYTLYTSTHKNELPVWKLKINYHFPFDRRRKR